MATYLIDYENVNKDGLNGVSRLTEKDRVIIFYSAKADRMTFGLHRRLNETKATVEYRRVDVGGHNALDFQLATWLGFLISQDSSEEYCIVSNDRGFEFLAGFWRKPLYNVTRTREIAESPQAEERRQQRQHEREEAMAAAALEHDRTAAEPDLSGRIRTEQATEWIEAQESADQLKKTGQPEDTASPERRFSEKAGVQKEGTSWERTEHQDAERDPGWSAETESESLQESPERPESGSLPESGESVHADDQPEAAASVNLTAFPAEETRPETAVEKAETAERPEGPLQPMARDTGYRMAPGDDMEHTELMVLRDESRELVQVDRAPLAPAVQTASVPVTEAPATKEAGGTKGNPEKKKNPKKKAASRTKSATDASRKKQGTPKEPRKEKLRADVAQCISALELAEDERLEIASYIDRYKTKLGINNALVRKFGTQKAGEIYKAIKPLLKDKKGDAEKTASNDEKELLREVKNLTGEMELTEEDLQEIASSVHRCKTRQGVNNALVRRFRSQKAGEIYKLIKPLLKDKKGRNHS